MKHLKYLSLALLLCTEAKAMIKNSGEEVSVEKIQKMISKTPTGEEIKLKIKNSEFGSHEELIKYIDTHLQDTKKYLLIQNTEDTSEVIKTLQLKSLDLTFVRDQVQINYVKKKADDERDTYLKTEEDKETYKTFCYAFRLYSYEKEALSNAVNLFMASKELDLESFLKKQTEWFLDEKKGNLRLKTFPKNVLELFDESGESNLDTFMKSQITELYEENKKSALETFLKNQELKTQVFYW